MQASPTRSSTEHQILNILKEDIAAMSQQPPPHVEESRPPQEPHVEVQETQVAPPEQQYLALESGEGQAYLPNGHQIDPHLSAQTHHSSVVDEASMQQSIESVINSVTQAQDAATHAATQAAMAAAQQARHKQTRVAQACDACSQRKVKCDATQPCRNCQDLGVECTRNRERRRRGPPNRVKERIEDSKRMRSENDADVSTAVASSINTHGFSMSQSSTDLIAPSDIISTLIEAFYTYVYPIHPFPHEIWLVQSYQRRADVGNHTYNPFLALISAMIGAVATLRPAQTSTLVRQFGYADVASFIGRCRAMCINARGVGYQDRADHDANDAVTSYFLAVMSAHEKQWGQYRACISDAVGIVHNQLLFGPPQARPDEIRRQTAYRVFWATFVLSRSIEHQQPLGSGSVSFPRFPMEPYTKYPSPLNDGAISAEGIFPDQQQSACPPTLCLNSLIHLYTAGDVPLAASSSPDFIDTGDLPTVRSNIFNAPAAVRSAFDGVDVNVRELVNNRRGLEESSNGATATEIQRTNIMLSTIVMRSYLINRALSQVLDSNAEITESESASISSEREHLARALLFMAKDLNMVGLEPDVWGSIALIKGVIADVCCDEKISSAEVGQELQRFIMTFSVAEDAVYSGASADSNGTDRLTLKQWQEAFLGTKLAASIDVFA